MRNEPTLDTAASLVSPGWVERRLNVSRTTRLALEDRGVLIPVRLTGSSHRRYRLSDVEALISSADSSPEAGGPQSGEVSPTSPLTPSAVAE